ncbi:MarR family winged helix-turn-helix transcriptional regulator [Paeniglutamicibacter sp. Y32M11]|uniref:MarR family winged helix-turn-helix transcriptional regulator n=1 Tax=Paeniglutamicibacter sp. Y32M11 TaxID=2853258 RepID=UPI001C52CF47|nr:MarR family winged helix-turn-helix transcriptional regulator [Paeniglutamicibacter sp. Y32M11]QXQ10117.1 MarR family winged helix-turn-helix transcriptional regulator [Paeniglutamicibacter sp. Y32M11]
MGTDQRDADIQAVYNHMQVITRRANARSRHLAEPLTFVEHSLLRFIADTPGVRAIDIAEAFSLNRSTVSRQVATLIELGLANYDETDAGRGRVLVLTDHGHQQLATSAQVHREVVTDRLAGWSDQEIASFAEALIRYNDADSK